MSHQPLTDEELAALDDMSPWDYKQLRLSYAVLRGENERLLKERDGARARNAQLLKRSKDVEEQAGDVARQIAALRATRDALTTESARLKKELIEADGFIGRFGREVSRLQAENARLAACAESAVVDYGQLQAELDGVVQNVQALRDTARKCNPTDAALISALKDIRALALDSRSDLVQSATIATIAGIALERPMHACRSYYPCMNCDSLECVETTCKRPPAPDNDEVMIKTIGSHVCQACRATLPRELLTIAREIRRRRFTIATTLYPEDRTLFDKLGLLLAKMEML